MSRLFSILKAFSQEESGNEALEWTLLLAGAALPLAFFVLVVGKMVAHYYSFVSYVISLPF
jgi:Flp pilus assembly pilin Flp